MSDYATEQGHWYRRDGSPCYTLPKSTSAGDKKTTLADARKLDLVPSVTTLLKLLNKYSLNQWREDQMMLAAMTLPRKPGESEMDFIKRVKGDSRTETVASNSRGKALHADIHRALLGQPHDHRRHVEAIACEMKSVGLDFYRGTGEHSFAAPEGYGGKIDWWHCEDFADFKSKPFIEYGKKLTWDDHIYQLSAYGNGVGVKQPNCYSIFVGVEDSKVVIHKWSREDTELGLRVFLLLKEIWEIQKRFGKWAGQGAA